MTLSTWSSLLSKNLLTVLNATSQASLLGNLQAPVPMQGNACIEIKLYIWTKWSYYWPQVVLDHHVQTRCVTSLEGLCWSSVVRWNSWYDVYNKLIWVFLKKKKESNCFWIYYILQEVCGPSWSQRLLFCSHFSGNFQWQEGVPHTCGSACPLKFIISRISLKIHCSTVYLQCLHSCICPWGWQSHQPLTERCLLCRQTPCLKGRTMSFWSSPARFFQSEIFSLEKVLA